MSTRFTRPPGSYDSTSVTTNKDKYQDDDTADTAIDAPKVDGDFNQIIDNLNALDDDIDSVVAAGIADGDKGDITVSASGTTWSVDPDSVSYDKMQDITADYRVLGTVTGAGTVTEVAILDEDTLVSDSNISLATQQSIKAYVDGLIGSATPTGCVEAYLGSTAPSTWVFLDGLTLGNAASSATGRANADTSALFTFFWDNLADSEAAVSTGRGASAAADYAANKTITIPDGRNRTLAGGDMGGGASSRLTSGVSGVDGTTLGASGGDQRFHQHNHSVTDPGHTHTTASTASTSVSGSGGFYPTGSTSTGSSTTGISIGNEGAGSSENVQPVLICNWIIKL